MSIDSWQVIKAVFGLTCISGGIFLTIKTAKDRLRVRDLQNLLKESRKCNLNSTSIRMEKQASRQHKNSMSNRAVSIEKVTAHFMEKDYPLVTFKSGKNDDFAKIDCLPFWVVEKTFSKVEYEMYQVQVKNALVSQNILIPDDGIFNPKQQQFPKNKSYLPTILTSASTLGIVGTLTLNSNSDQYIIEAKLIGQNLKQIEDYISSELLSKAFYLVAGGAFIIVGVGIFIDMYRDYRKARVPLQASLLR